ncbi:MAG: DMT family transporter [Paludibacteraceae bacterium]|nr:DMT family transporter [Paludibacteraceae bacterium]MBO5405251.1 DMT family transporter [Paludibacteraceae bacterium]MBQ9752391.1 DMT family transporter [Paludibacteraceae bacterium]
MKNKLWLLFILITVVTWGIWGAFSGYQIQHGIPDTVVYIAWALSMLPCALVALIINKGKLTFSWRGIGLGAIVGLLGAGGQLVLFKALTLGPSYIIYPFISMSPVVVITLASIFLKERANKWQIAGIVVALAAILLLSLETGNEGSPVTGWLWIVLAVLVLLAWGIQGFFMKFANESMDAESLFVYMALFAVVLAPVAYFMTPDAATFFAQEGAMAPFWSSFGIQILNSIGALTLVYAYRYGKAVVVSPMEGLAPMVTVLLSLVILHVIPNPLQIAGLVCAAFAMYALSK